MSSRSYNCARPEERSIKSRLEGHERTTTIAHNFKRSRRFNTWGGIICELVHLTSTLVLFKAFPLPVFAAVAVLKGFVSLSGKIADFGGSYILVPFFKHITTSKQSFAHFFRMLVVQQLPVAVGSLALGVWLLLPRAAVLTAGGPSLFAVVVLYLFLVFADCFLGVIRHLLNVALENHQLVIAEIGWYCVYQAGLWTSLLTTPTPWHLPLMLTGMGLFQGVNLFLIGRLALKFYKNLPDGDGAQTLQGSKILRVRLTQWLLRLCKEAYSVHVLVPFFYVTLGMREAVVFYITTLVASSMQTIIKMSIDYTSAGLFAQLKPAWHGRALGGIIKQLLLLIGGFLLVLIASTLLLPFFGISTSWHQVLIAGGYFTLCSLDQFMLPYQQLHTAAYRHVRYTTIKVIELGCACALLIGTGCVALGPAKTLVLLICLKTIVVWRIRI